MDYLNSWQGIITVGSAYGFPDSDAELLHTIEQLRVKVNTLTSPRWNLPPTTLPVLHDIDSFLGIVAVHVTGSLDSAPESRTFALVPANPLHHMRPDLDKFVHARCKLK
ncbi:hypothetical protein HPB50_029466 [Hyalomma asiaticum]|nr:hypothetical protein HPB50_029466 [Hyalomma asiaticum]